MSAQFRFFSAGKPLGLPPEGGLSISLSVSNAFEERSMRCHAALFVRLVMLDLHLNTFCLRDFELRTDMTVPVQPIRRYQHYLLPCPGKIGLYHHRRSSVLTI